MCIINAFVLLRLTHPKVPHLQFRQQLMHELVDLFRSNRNAVQASRGANVSVALVKDHYLIHTGSQRECMWCSQHVSNPPRPSYQCQECGVNLCVGECFMKYHTKHA